MSKTKRERGPVALLLAAILFFTIAVVAGAALILGDRHEKLYAGAKLVCVKTAERSA